MTTRGVRNCNPFNIRRTAARWQGKIYSSKEKSFEVFSSLSYGVRAGVIILRTYVRSHNLTTVKGIVSCFAPETENNTERYIAFCEDYLRCRGCDPNDIQFGNMAFCTLCSAMMYFESKFVFDALSVRHIIDRFDLK